MNAFLRRNHVQLALLLLIFLITTWPFISKFPISWDAAQFVLAVKHFDVGTHQPHPPGYPLFAGLAKLLHLVLPAHTSLVLLSALFALGAVLALYVFAWQLWSQPWIAFVAALGLIFNPLFWIYRETALTYTVNAFVATLVGLMSYLAITRNGSFAAWSALLLGVLSGFRPSTIVLSLPLFLVPFVYKPLRLAWRPVAILAAAIGAWLIPLLWFSGGIQSYFASSGRLFSASAETTSVLFGSSWSSTVGQLAWMIKILIASWNVVLLPTAAAVFLLVRGFVARDRWRQGGSDVEGEKAACTLALGLAWLLPSLFVYGFIHLGQIGYLLTITPLAYLISGRALLAIHEIRHAPRRRAAWISIAMLWIIHATPFPFFSMKYRDPSFEPAGPVDTLLRKLAAKRDELFLMNSEVIRKNDERVQALKQIVESYPAESTLVIAGRRPTPRPWWKAGVISSDEISRTMAAILPEYRIFDINPGQPYIVKAHRFRSAYLPAPAVGLSPSDRQVLFLFEDMPSQYVPEGIRLEKQTQIGPAHWIGRIEGSFEYAGITFVANEERESRRLRFAR